MYRLNKILEEDINDMITTDTIIDDNIDDEIIATVESQPDASEKKSLFEPKNADEVEESGFIYDPFGNFENIDLDKIF